MFPLLFPSVHRTCSVFLGNALFGQISRVLGILSIYFFSFSCLFSATAYTMETDFIFVCAPVFLVGGAPRCFSSTCLGNLVSEISFQIRHAAKISSNSFF